MRVETCSVVIRLTPFIFIQHNTTLKERTDRQEFSLSTASQASSIMVRSIIGIAVTVTVTMMMNHLATAFQPHFSSSVIVAPHRSPTSSSSSSSSTLLFMNKKRRDRDRSAPKGFGAAIRQLQLDTFPYAGSVRPGKQSPQRIVVEEGVVKPDYWDDGVVRKIYINLEVMCDCDV